MKLVKNNSKKTSAAQLKKTSLKKLWSMKNFILRDKKNHILNQNNMSKLKKSNYTICKEHMKHSNKYGKVKIVSDLTCQLCKKRKMKMKKKWSIQNFVLKDKKSHILNQNSSLSKKLQKSNYMSADTVENIDVKDDVCSSEFYKTNISEINENTQIIDIRNVQQAENDMQKVEKTLKSMKIQNLDKIIRRIKKNKKSGKNVFSVADNRFAIVEKMHKNIGFNSVASEITTCTKSKTLSSCEQLNKNFKYRNHNSERNNNQNCEKKVKIGTGTDLERNDENDKLVTAVQRSTSDLNFLTCSIQGTRSSFGIINANHNESLNQSVNTNSAAEVNNSKWKDSNSTFSVIPANKVAETSFSTSLLSDQVCSDKPKACSNELPKHKVKSYLDELQVNIKKRKYDNNRKTENKQSQYPFQISDCTSYTMSQSNSLLSEKVNKKLTCGLKKSKTSLSKSSDSLNQASFKSETYNKKEDNYCEKIAESYNYFDSVFDLANPRKLDIKISNAFSLAVSDSNVLKNDEENLPFRTQNASTETGKQSFDFENPRKLDIRIINTFSLAETKTNVLETNEENLPLWTQNASNETGEQSLSKTQQESLQNLNSFEKNNHNFENINISFSTETATSKVQPVYLEEAKSKNIYDNGSDFGIRMMTLDDICNSIFSSTTYTDIEISESVLSNSENGNNNMSSTLKINSSENPYPYEEKIQFFNVDANEIKNSAVLCNLLNVSVLKKDNCKSTIKNVNSSKNCSLEALIMQAKEDAVKSKTDLAALNEKITDVKKLFQNLNKTSMTVQNLTSVPINSNFSQNKQAKDNTDKNSSTDFLSVPCFYQNSSNSEKINQVPYVESVPSVPSFDRNVKNWATVSKNLAQNSKIQQLKAVEKNSDPLQMPTILPVSSKFDQNKCTRSNIDKNSLATSKSYSLKNFHKPRKKKISRPLIICLNCGRKKKDYSGGCSNSVVINCSHCPSNGKISKPLIICLTCGQNTKKCSGGYSNSFTMQCDFCSSEDKVSYRGPQPG